MIKCKLECIAKFKKRHFSFCEVNKPEVSNIFAKRRAVNSWKKD